MGLFGNNSTVTTTFKGKDDLSPVVRGMRNTMEGFKRDAKTGFGLASGISIFDTARQGLGMVADAAADSIRMASDHAEAQSKVSVVFGEQARSIEQWADTAATSMGMTETAALKASGTLGNLFDGLGIANDAGLEMSKTITQLAADLGSFNNVATDDALTALQSGLLGEAEPMRRFGSALSAARVEAYGFANGLYETIRVGNQNKRVMSEAQKVQARYALILEDTKNAQGDFARTSDGLANSSKILNAELADIQTEIGEQLIPVVTELAKAARDDLVPALVLATDHLDELIAAARLATVLVPEFGSSLGDTSRIVSLRLKHLERTAVVVSGTWGASMGDMGDSSEEAGQDIYTGLVRPTRRAMRDMFKTAKDAKAPWKAVMKSLVEAGKDPFEDDKFAGWMQRKARKFVRNAQRAFRHGRGDWRAEAKALAYVMTNPILVALADTEEEIRRLANAAQVILDVQGRIGNYRRNGSTGKNPNAQIGDTGGVGDFHNATGGATSGISVVGEYGPEIIRSGSAKAHVTPSHAGRGDIVLQIDGYTLMRWIDNRMGRQMAFSGLGD